jgi:hypothetical protein
VLRMYNIWRPSQPAGASFAGTMVAATAAASVPLRTGLPFISKFPFVLTSVHHRLELLEPLEVRNRWRFVGQSKFTPCQFARVRSNRERSRHLRYFLAGCRARQAATRILSRTIPGSAPGISTGRIGWALSSAGRRCVGAEPRVRSSCACCCGERDIHERDHDVRLHRLKARPLEYARAGRQRKIRTLRLSRQNSI